MVTRRDLLLGAAAGYFGGSAWGDELSGDPRGVLAVLPGKRPLIRRAIRPPNYETPLKDLVADFTPNDLFFVRYHLSQIPRVDAATWRLEVSGASAQRPLTLSLADLKSGFEHVTVAAVNQCSGFRRGLFDPRVPGVQWGSGAIGNALWGGVRLRDVLQRAGVGADALEVVYRGADGPALPETPAFVKSIPVERALDEHTLIAFEMNGAPLPHWNGAPARLVVPGWTGTYWMKHLTQVRVEPKPFDGFWMKAAYRIPTGAFPGERFASQETKENTPITEILVDSLITAPAAGARLKRGQHAALAGKAWDNGSGIEAVEVSTDGRHSWRPATLGRDLGRFAWRSFHVPLDTARAGPLDVSVRARSRNGSMQPEKLTFNAAGYHDNIIQNVAVVVV
ncbi:MAG TPA: molybdopterin-dependent oxidoreductase [Steroidobacteraceae bacterium]|nr:molybdopterin-dependent oxidoreductase [Steroidobacteraceae bacterium]